MVITDNKVEGMQGEEKCFPETEKFVYYRKIFGSHESESHYYHNHHISYSQESARGVE